jgi:serine/threonine-protein kinase
MVSRSRGDFWIYDLATATMSRLTTDSATYYGEWSPDGRYFYYVHLLDKTNTVIRRRVDGSAPAESLFSDRELESFALHPGGQKIVYTQNHGHGVQQLVVREMPPNSPAHPLTGFPNDATAFRFSPDGRWLAYTSSESGRAEVYVRPFPGPGSRVQVSPAGGAEPVWAPDGTRLFYRDNAGRDLFVATLDPARAMTVLSRRKLFSGNFDWDWDIADYDVSRDGKELLMVRFPNEDQEIVVTTHWEKVLRERLRVGN